MTPIPSKIAGFRSDVINQILDCLQELQPIRTNEFHHERTARGIVTRLSGLQAETDTFPWDQLQFGWSNTLSDGSMAAGYIRILQGSVIKGSNTPVVVPQADVSIAISNTYVGIQVARDMTSASIIAQGTQPVTDDDHVRFWFYIFKSTSGVVALVTANLGQIMNVDLTAYGDA